MSFTSELIEAINGLGAQVRAITEAEMDGLRHLGDTLEYADTQVLHEVRRVITAHAGRRDVLLHELTALAQRIGGVRQVATPAASEQIALDPGDVEPDRMPRIVEQQRRAAPPPLEERFTDRGANGQHRPILNGAQRQAVAS